MVASPNDLGTTTDSIDERLLKALAGHIDDEHELNAVLDGQPFYAATSLDSVGYLELVVELEAIFGISFDGADAQQIFASFDDLAGFLRHKTRK